MSPGALETDLEGGDLVLPLSLPQRVEGVGLQAYISFRTHSKEPGLPQWPDSPRALQTLSPPQLAHIKNQVCLGLGARWHSRSDCCVSRLLLSFPKDPLTPRLT